MTPFKIAWLVMRGHFDVVHINVVLNPKSLIRDGLILFALRAVRFRRVLVYFHGWQPAMEAYLRQPLLRPVFVWLVGGTAHIMVLAPEFKKFLVSIGVPADHITVTRTMFDGTFLNAGKSSLLPKDRRSILFMSRFVREKGIYELLNAFARIAPDFPDVDLIMAGDGKENTELQMRASSLNLHGRIAFPGYVSGSQKSQLLQQCTVFALPTYYPEGMPIALLEAMAAGKPLLTAHAGAIGHIINDPQNGVVLDAVNVTALEAALRRLLGDPGYCDSVGQRNKDVAWSRFEAGAVTREIEASYGRIAKQ